MWREGCLEGRGRPPWGRRGAGGNPPPSALLWPLPAALRPRAVPAAAALLRRPGDSAYPQDGPPAPIHLCTVRRALWGPAVQRCPLAGVCWGPTACGLPLPAPWSPGHEGSARPTLPAHLKPALPWGADGGHAGWGAGSLCCSSGAPGLHT